MGSFGITVNLNPMTGDLLIRGEGTDTETRPGRCYCPTRCDPMDCSTPGFPVHHHLPEFAQTHVHWVSDAIQPSHPLSSPSIFPSISLFQWVSSLHQVVKYCCFSSSISPSNEYSGLISLKIDWFDLLASQGTLKSLLQLHSSKASILQLSVFFKVQLISVHDYWKNRSFDYVDLCLQSDVSGF